MEVKNLTFHSFLCVVRYVKAVHAISMIAEQYLKNVGIYMSICPVGSIRIRNFTTALRLPKCISNLVSFWEHQILCF